jgi:hypothetical protein
VLSKPPPTRDLWRRRNGSIDLFTQLGLRPLGSLLPESAKQAWPWLDAGNPGPAFFEAAPDVDPKPNAVGADPERPASPIFLQRRNSRFHALRDEQFRTQPARTVLAQELSVDFVVLLLVANHTGAEDNVVALHR